MANLISRTLNVISKVQKTINLIRTIADIINLVQSGGVTALVENEVRTIIGSWGNPANFVETARLLDRCHRALKTRHLRARQNQPF